jgi:hypothetical protein
VAHDRESNSTILGNSRLASAFWRVSQAVCLPILPLPRVRRQITSTSASSAPREKISVKLKLSAASVVSYKPFDGLDGKLRCVLQ